LGRPLTRYTAGSRLGGKGVPRECEAGAPGAWQRLGAAPALDVLYLPVIYTGYWAPAKTIKRPGSGLIGGL
jgi:hypothetical protein